MFNECKWDAALCVEWDILIEMYQRLKLTIYSYKQRTLGIETSGVLVYKAYVKDLINIINSYEGCHHIHLVSMIQRFPAPQSVICGVVLDLRWMHHGAARKQHLKAQTGKRHSLHSQHGKRGHEGKGAPAEARDFLFSVPPCLYDRMSLRSLRIRLQESSWMPQKRNLDVILNQNAIDTESESRSIACKFGFG